MGWLDKIGSFRLGGTAVAEAPEDGIGGVGSAEASGPPLVCLVTDASGTASYKRHVFSDIDSATDFVLYWFPNQNEGGIISFWAMTYEPRSGLDSAVETNAEPLVMIRDHVRDDLVYLFSFTGIESALAFLREEVRHGVDLAAMMLYWAVPVRMAADPWGKMVLTPSVPPGIIAPEAAVAPLTDMWTPTPAAPAHEEPEQPAGGARSIFEEAPNADTGVADPVIPGMDTFELTSWMDRPSDKPAKDKNTAAQVREWLAEREAQAAEPQVETRWEPRPQAKDTAAQVREWLAQRPEAIEPLPQVEEHSLPIAEAQEPVLEEAPAQPAWIEDAPPAVEVSAESTFTAEPIKAAFVEDRAIVSEVAEAALEPVVEAVQEPEPEVIVELHPEAIVAPAFEAVQEPARQTIVAEAADGTTEPEVQRATIRVHTNGNGHSRKHADRHQSTEHEIPPEEAGAAVHENGNGYEQTAESHRHAPATQVEYTNADEAHSEPSVDIRIEIHVDSSRALKVKRWEAKEEPFDGFNSPPGRF